MYSNNIITCWDKHLLAANYILIHFEKKLSYSEFGIFLVIFFRIALNFSTYLCTPIFEMLRFQLS